MKKEILKKKALHCDYFLIGEDEYICGFCKHWLSLLKIVWARGAWVAQSVEHPTLAWVMISRSVSSSPTSGSVLIAQSLEPALDSVSPSVSAPPPTCTLSLSQKK